MNPADIAALLYAIIAIGEAASQAVQQMRGSQVSEDEFRRAWEAMKLRLADANALWTQAVALAERSSPKASDQ
jgi:hypothetical protein